MKTIKLVKRDEKYINSKTVKAYHLLIVKGGYHLIGSKSIRNLIYSNDYDLNESFNIENKEAIFNRLYHHFLEIFDKCYKQENLYILDFKCGETNKGKPLRWSYDDMKKGYKTINKTKYVFTDCLKQTSSIIKIDLCFILDNEPLDITNNYFIHIVNNKSELGKTQKLNLTDNINSLQNDINELLKEHKYFKALKRQFAIEVLNNKINPKLVEFLNSDYGRFYKTIHDLAYLRELYDNNFKPVNKVLILDNLERIKEFTSYITLFDVNPMLDKLNYIISHNSNLDNQLVHLIVHCEKLLNDVLKGKIKQFM